MKFFKKKRVILLAAVAIVVCLLFARHFYNKTQVFYAVDYEQTDISQLIRSAHISENDYMLIYAQTGVSPRAAKNRIENGDFAVLEQLNKLYFEAPETELDYICYPITAEETNTTQKTPLADLQKGDILISFNTHTLDWRHGHCGIVVDAKNAIALEHMSVGNTSCLTNATAWGYYPAFLVLRHKDAKVADAAADYAYKNLVDTKYSIFAGMLNKDKSDDTIVDSSHCSHIVWQAYKAVGADLDYNGGPIVTPRDISKSDALEVVQIYGINPKPYADRIMK